MVDNRMGDNYGNAFQANVIGSITVHSPPAAPVPGWVDTALPVHQCEAGELGAHNTFPGSEGEGLPPYVVRDVDDELDRRLAAAVAAPRGGLVLVAGASTAGKTRALAAALGRTLPDRMLVAPPEDADLRPLPAWLLERAARAPQGWVLWLDDLDRHLGASGLTPALVAELGQVGAVVAATIRGNQLEALRPGTTDHASASEGVGYAVLKTPPVVVERRWSPQERERARASGDERLVQAADDARFGVAEQLAAGPLLKRTWHNGLESGHPRGYALVAAAVGLAAAGVSSALTREQIQAAHGPYLPGPPPLPEEADQAWAWATRPRSGLAGLLVPADHEGRRWRAFDYLTLQGPLPEAVWHAALDTATDQDRFAVALAASRADLADVAETAWSSLAERGHPGAMLGLGSLLYKAGRFEEAETWWHRAAELGHPNAMFNLGGLLKEAGRFEEAETWFRRIAGGDTEAMHHLGLLLVEVGRVEEAEGWYRQAAGLGCTDAMNNLGVLLKESGRAGESETWYRQAAGLGHTGAMHNLGVLLEEAGRVEEAESWFRQAAGLGHTDAMNNLGGLLKVKGRAGEAEVWFGRAADEGNADAMSNLGVLLVEAGRAGEAEGWFRRAAETGNAGAVFNLGLLLVEVGRAGESEAWFRRAAEAGNPRAMSNLGVLLEKSGRVEEAEGWYRQAAELGHTGARHNLGVLLAKAGKVEEAEAWYRRARTE